MRILVIGCGSIGTRRARILMDLGHKVDGIDDDPSRAAKATDGHATDWTKAQALQVPYDAALVCAPPGGHRFAVAGCLAAGIRGVFVEKPVATLEADLNTLETLPRVYPEAVTMAACNTRFDSRLRDLAGISPAEAVFRMGQHLNHWSPTHQPISLALDDFHELDLAVSMLGPAKTIEGYSERDVAHLTINHESGATSRIALDRITSPPVREVHFTHTDGRTRAISIWPPEPEMYVREMEHFLDCVERGVPTCNPIPEAAALCLQLLTSIEWREATA